MPRPAEPLQTVTGRNIGDLMERRISPRAATDIEVTLFQQGQITQCRGIEISTTGAVLDGPPCHPDLSGGTLRMELRIPGRRRPIRAVAVRVRQHGRRQAVRFMQLRDGDHLSLAHHILTSRMAPLGQA